MKQVMLEKGVIYLVWRVLVVEQAVVLGQVVVIERLKATASGLTCTLLSCWFSESWLLHLAPQVPLTLVSLFLFALRLYVICKDVFRAGVQRKVLRTDPVDIWQGTAARV